MKRTIVGKLIMSKIVDSKYWLIWHSIPGYRAVLLAGVFFCSFLVYNALTFGVWDDDNLALQWTKAEPSKEKPAVLVVSAPVFEPALQPWIEYRQSQGYDIFLLPLALQSPEGNVDFGVQTQPIATPEEIRAKIIKASKDREIAAIVLVGDGAPTINARYGWRDVVPAARVPASVVQTFGSEDLLATDSFYADFDSDGLADVPIGRFPAETPEELSVLVEKIIRYETTSPVGNWMRRINVFAGPNGLDLRVIGAKPGEEMSGPNPLGGISSLVDSVVSNMARRMFAEYLPQEFSVSLTQCSLQSVFCPYPPDFNDVFLERANDGSLFLIYMGHGYVYGLDRFETESKDYGIFEIDDCESLRCDKTSPIALFFACYTGAYDARETSLAEKVALSPNGPAAVYAASRLTAPYGMCVLGASLMERAFSENEEEPPLLGQIILDAQKKSLDPPKEPEEDADDSESELNEDLIFDDSVAEKNDVDNDSGKNADSGSDNDQKKPLKPGSQLEKLNKRLEDGLANAEKIKRENSSFRLILDRSARVFDPTASRLNDQIIDHLHEFNLFGDPLLRIRFPERVKIEAPEIAYSTKELVVSGTIPNQVDKESVVQVELLPADFRSTVQKTKRERSFIESEENKQEYRETYKNANIFVEDAVRTSTRNGRFQATIVVPRDYSGESVVRIAAFNGTDYYIGSQRVLVRPYKDTKTVDQ